MNLYIQAISAQVKAHAIMETVNAIKDSLDNNVNNNLVQISAHNKPVNLTFHNLIVNVIQNKINPETIVNSKNASTIVTTKEHVIRKLENVLAKTITMVQIALLWKYH